MFHKCKDEAEVKAIFRRVAKRLHPDHGGEHELMILLQESYEMALESKKVKEKSYTDYMDELKREYEKRAKEPPKPKWEPFNGIYEKVTEKVEEGDPRLEILDEIFDYSSRHESFDESFAHSVRDFLHERGFLTSMQYNALVKIYYAFNMNEPDDVDDD